MNGPKITYGRSRRLPNGRVRRATSAVRLDEHGTERRYQQGCSLPCCRAAHAAYCQRTAAGRDARGAAPTRRASRYATSRTLEELLAEWSA